jgi:putative glutathione S-transferase
MAGLVNGKWVNSDIAAEEIKAGSFQRQNSHFRQQHLASEAGRYQLFVSYLCPWACRTLIFRQLKGLSDVIALSVAQPVIGENGWTFTRPQDAGTRLPEVQFVHQLYTASQADYTGKVSVPVLWDRKQGCIVNNESADIIRLLNHAFDDLTGNTLDLYPLALRSQIDHWNDIIYQRINNGVYQCGFAKTQESYQQAVLALFTTLDQLDKHLGQSRYLAGEYLTEADWRLFVTLVRFDCAYHGLFKCNIRRIEDYPHLSGYLRELYQWPGIADTVDIDAIKQGYYGITWLNPTAIVPAGPQQDFLRAHQREMLPGKGIFDKSIR